MEESFILNKHFEANHEFPSELLVSIKYQHNNVFNIAAYRFFILSCVIFGGTCLSVFIFTMFTSYIERNNISMDSDSETESESESESESEIDYINKYIDSYENLEEIKLEKEFLQTLKENFIEDDTPEGTVLMNYDNDLDAFTYYTDKKNIPYDYLETVGRLFIIENNCKSIFVNYKAEIEKSKAELEVEIAKKEKEEREKEEREKEDQERDAEEEKKPERRSVFASFKTYKSEKVNKNKGTNKEKDDLVMPEKANKYIYKGKLLDYELEINNNAINEDFEHIDYNTFKKNQ